MESRVAKEIVEQLVYRMDESSRMIKITLEKLSEADVWQRPNAKSNSIGNIMLHLCGNIQQYAVASLGGQEDTRDRDREFALEDGMTKTELLSNLEQTVERAKAVMRSIGLEELLRKRRVQGFELSGIGIIVHVVEHYSYHTGQIAFWVKQLKNQDLGFYEGMDLTAKNTE
ncbi:MAG: DinB family protein [Bacteroidota bacterium]